MAFYCSLGISKYKRDTDSPNP